MHFIIVLYRLACLVHGVIYLLIVYGHFKRNLCDGSLPNSTGTLPVFHHRPPYIQILNSKLSPIKNPCDIHVHNSFLNVAIHMPCINIHHAGHYQLEMVIAHTRLPAIAVGNALHGSDCV